MKKKLSLMNEILGLATKVLVIIDLTLRLISR